MNLRDFLRCWAVAIPSGERILGVCVINMLTNVYSESASCLERLRTQSCPECNVEISNVSNNQEIIRLMRYIKTVPLADTSIPIVESQSNSETIVVCQLCSEETATLYCTKCTLHSLCKSCSEFVHSKSSNAGHELTPWTAKYVVLQCLKHKEDCKLYCLTDKVPICSLCVHDTHRNHSTSLVSTEYESSVDRIHQATEILQEQIAACRSVATAVDKEYSDLVGRSFNAVDKGKEDSNHAPETTAANAIARINDAFDQLISAAHERRRALIVCVDQMVKDKRIALEAQMLELDLFVAKSLSLCQTQSSRIRGECDGWVLANESRLIGQLTSFNTEGASLRRTPVKSSVIVPHLEEVRKATDACTTWGGVSGNPIASMRISSLCGVLLVGSNCTVTAVLYDANGNKITSGGDGDLISMWRKSPADSAWVLINDVSKIMETAAILCHLLLGPERQSHYTRENVAQCPGCLFR